MSSSDSEIFSSFTSLEIPDSENSASAQPEASNVSTKAIIPAEEKQSTSNTASFCSSPILQSSSVDIQAPDKSTISSQSEPVSNIKTGAVPKQRKPRNSRKRRSQASEKVLKDNSKKQSEPVFDVKGIDLETEIDLCDCLKLECKGCFSKCTKCGSSKCGAECRVNRTYHYETFEFNESKNINTNAS